MNRKKGTGFTLIELMTVIVIIVILMGLILSVSNYAQEKAKRSRAQSEVQALCTALESYKVDNGGYPQNDDTDTAVVFNTATNKVNLATAAANKYLYQQLSGDTDYNNTLSTAEKAAQKAYFDFQNKKSMLTIQGGLVLEIRDPWGIAYGYSTARATQLRSGDTGASKGFNPTFDLWSIANTQEPTDCISNW